MGSELFYPYQQRWISNDSRFKIGMFARQTGKTFTTTFEIARDCQLADLAGKRQRWVILSRGERQAKEAIEEGVKRHCQALGSLVRTVHEMGRKVIIEGLEREKQFSVISSPAPYQREGSLLRGILR